MTATDEQLQQNCMQLSNNKSHINWFQGNSGREDVLFLRLYLLQSLLSYIEGNDAQARLQLSKVGRRSSPDRL